MLLQRNPWSRMTGAVVQPAVSWLAWTRRRRGSSVRGRRCGCGCRIWARTQGSWNTQVSAWRSYLLLVCGPLVWMKSEIFGVCLSPSLQWSVLCPGTVDQKFQFLRFLENRYYLLNVSFLKSDQNEEPGWILCVHLGLSCELHGTGRGKSVSSSIFFTVLQPKIVSL